MQNACRSVNLIPAKSLIFFLVASPLTKVRAILTKSGSQHDSKKVQHRLKQPKAKESQKGGQAQRADQGFYYFDRGT